MQIMIELLKQIEEGAQDFKIELEKALKDLSENLKKGCRKMINEYLTLCNIYGIPAPRLQLDGVMYCVTQTLIKEREENEVS